MRIRARVILPALCGALGACGTTDVDLGDPPGTLTITEQDLRTDLAFLASDEMGGRLTGTPEIAAAADWVAERFSELGLAPGGPDGTYFQDFELVTFALGAEGNVMGLGRPGGLALGTDFYPVNISASGGASGQVVFVGYGIEAARIPHSDYGDADLTGRVLLMMDGEPGPDDRRSPFDGVVRSEASRDLRKVWAAQARGVTAVLFVADVENGDPPADLSGSFEGYWPTEPRRIERFSLGVWTRRVTVPVVRISTDFANRLALAGGQSLQSLATLAQAEGGIVPVPLGNESVHVSASVNQQVHRGRNVLGKIEGASPDLADEVVFVTAHHDHNGYDDEGPFNGADDDGSGTVGVLEVAAAYAEAAEYSRRPERTVVFAAWDAEERGLLGAWYYTEAPTYPLGQVAAVINMDMIGRNEEVPSEPGARFRGLEPQTAESNELAINILGTNYSSDLRGVLEPMAGTYDLELKFRYNNNASNLLRRSDHWPFLQNGVPAVWLHTGLHPDYHTRNDDPDRINYPKMTRIVKMAHAASWQLANQPPRPRFDR